MTEHGTNDGYSGYEEDGERDEKVKQPSFMDNFRFGKSGDQRQAGTRGLPGSFGEALGRIAKGNQGETSRPSIQGQTQTGPSVDSSQAVNPQKAQFKSLLGLLGL